MTEERKRPSTRSSELSVSPDKELHVGGEVTLDLTGLTEEQVQALKAKYAEMVIESKAHELKIATDLQALDRALSTMASKTAEVADQEGASVTMTKTQDDAMGRTEIIMGTSEAAKSGKLSRSQAGTDNMRMWVIVAAIIGGSIVLAALLR